MTAFFTAQRIISRSQTTRASRCAVRVQAHKVTIQFEGKNHVLEVDASKGSVLDVVLDAGLKVPHDCRSGVCMQCSARMVSGKVDQGAGMLSEDVIQQGYALLCVAQPTTDCEIRIIPEEELMDVQLMTSKQ